MRLPLGVRSLVAYGVVFLAACGQSPTGFDEEVREVPTGRVMFQQQNGDTIQYLGDITATVLQIAATGPFWHSDRWWTDNGVGTLVPWTPPEGSGGSGTPANYTPWTPPNFQPDSACKIVANETVGFHTLAGHDGPMNSKKMIDSMKVMFDEARAANTEMGGYFYKITASSPIMFQRLAANPDSTDQCAFQAMGGHQTLGAVIGWFHTHQAPEGIWTPCAKLGGGLNPNNLAGGGGSPPDWDAANIEGISRYTIDANHIWRLDPGVLPEDREANPNRWVRTPSGCATRFVPTY